MSREELFTQFDNVFFEKTRLSMMTVLYKEDMVSFNRLKKIIGGSDGAIYTHLQKLQEAGYVDQKKEIIGSKVQSFFYLTRDGKGLFKKYLKFMEEMIVSHK